ncbi:MAG TPA: TatD family hydrolase, partial [Syntrophales bacterium]|nr:TatD family hydrolase [Syntrophales bacterium]
SGDWAMARRCLDLGFYISIAGPVTYPKNEKLRDIARRVPLDRLLVETDAPYLAPQTLRGRRNEPAYVVHAAGEIAAVRSIPLAELDRATTQNAARLFGLPNSLAFPETKS